MQADISFYEKSICLRLTEYLQEKIVEKQSKLGEKANYLENDYKMQDQEELSLFEIFNSYSLTTDLMKKIRNILQVKIQIWT